MQQAMMKVQRTIKVKKSVLEATRRIIKIKKGLPIPPVNLCPISQTEEAFEILRDYCEFHEMPVSQGDLKWYYDAIDQDKKEMNEFWIANPTMKVILDSVSEGKSDEARFLAEKEAKKREPVKADTGELGPMPEYGSGEFWAWCRKRKMIRLAKEAAIIAAGGSVPPAKVKKPKVQKPKVQKPKA